MTSKEINEEVAERDKVLALIEEMKRTATNMQVNIDKLREGLRSIRRDLWAYPSAGLVCLESAEATVDELLDIIGPDLNDPAPYKEENNREF